MFSPAIEKQRQQLYAHTVEQMEQRLHGVTEAVPAFAALRWGMDAIDRAYETTPAKIRAQVACRAGCGHCCQVSVDVQAHEVFFAAEFIQVNFSPEALAEVITKTAARRVALAAATATKTGTDKGGRDRFMQACALLRDGSCSIYAGRPEACRVHHASDASVCAAHIADPTVDLTKVYVPPLRARLFAVMLGMDEAIEAESFDDRAYDFGAALHEALTNSLCLTLWLRRKPAFPDSCLAG